MAERENVVDFTVPYYDLVGITILMKKPKAATSLFKFLTVLENDVWLCILAAYFFTRFEYGSLCLPNILRGSQITL
jgi:ionotropic glutamate receptor